MFSNQTYPISKSGLSKLSVERIQQHVLLYSLLIMLPSLIGIVLIHVWVDNDLNIWNQSHPIDVLLPFFKIKELADYYYAIAEDFKCPRGGYLNIYTHWCEQNRRIWFNFKVTKRKCPDVHSQSCKGPFGSPWEPKGSMHPTLRTNELEKAVCVFLLRP